MASDGTVLYAYLDVPYYEQRGQCRRAVVAWHHARRVHAEGHQHADDIGLAMRKAERAMARCARRRPPRP